MNEKIYSSDKRVVDFLRSIGFNPDIMFSITIIIEAGEYLRFEDIEQAEGKGKSDE